MQTETYIVSSSLGWCESVEIDPEIFGESKQALIEAGTQVLEKFVKNEGKSVGIVVEVYQLKDLKNYNQHHWLPTYLLLNNASMYREAEKFRSIVLEKTGIDAKKDVKKE